MLVSTTHHFNMEHVLGDVLQHAAHQLHVFAHMRACMHACVAY